MLSLNINAKIGVLFLFTSGIFAGQDISGRETAEGFLLLERTNESTKEAIETELRQSRENQIKLEENLRKALEQQKLIEKTGQEIKKGHLAEIPKESEWARAKNIECMFQTLDEIQMQIPKIEKNLREERAKIFKLETSIKELQAEEKKLNQNKRACLTDFRACGSITGSRACSSITSQCSIM